MSDFTTLLVANRGEIALRVMRTARALGLHTVAVYSDADGDAPHVRFADTAVRLGPAPAGQSYLDAGMVIAAAQSAGAQAIHPGYGFLSENADFARACAEAGLVFIGPPAEAIEVMGDKARAKRAMIAAGVPCVPGYQEADQSEPALRSAAEAIGFPLMVKAAAGGGGRGMRLVEDAGALADALSLARSEAENAFGAGDLILERAVLRPRHVEIQVFADAHGQVIHLGERDCSLQRRHQKIVEEAPCPVLSDDLRARMGKAAIDAARAVDYRGAGTVEFLLDTAGDFYFLEMNTRLQVEHPVTEMITGLDLVALQIAVARGEPLGLDQEAIGLDGHAIEVRLYAEDPARGFLPSTGRIDLWQPPSGPGLRIDDGIETGGTVSPHYDPMLAKLVAHGPTREVARQRLLRGLRETALIGPTSNRDFLIDALQQTGFVAGEVTTAFIGETYGEAGFCPPAPGAKELAIAAVLQFALGARRARAAALDVPGELMGWSSAGQRAHVTEYDCGGNRQTVSVRQTAANTYIATPGERDVEVTLSDLGETPAHLNVDGQGTHVGFHAPGASRIDLALPWMTARFDNLAAMLERRDEAGGGRVTAPMHGRLLEILVAPGDAVRAGTRLAVLEAMKMQHEILAEIDGTVGEVLAEAGVQIGADDLILEIAPDTAEAS